jgi:uncharacterized iron-regulated protein
MKFKQLTNHFVNPVTAITLLLATAFALVSCTATPAHNAASDSNVETQIVTTLAHGGIVLFGEVHDNRALHAERNRIVANVVAAGARPAFAFEQFDREAQPRIDSILSDAVKSTQSLIDGAAPARSSWDWNFYRPLIELALAHRLPIIAANLSRGDAMKIAISGLQSTTVFDPVTRQQLALDSDVPAAIHSAQMDEIKRGHCNLLPESMLPNMADAQIARDAIIARALKTNRASTRGVILFAGNGHVRRDIGVPRWLDASVPVFSIGMLEVTSTSKSHATKAEPYHSVITRDAEPRADPCVALRERFSRTTPPK